jgi:5-(carboxyamino)imidazole ribonucleotide synthase
LGGTREVLETVWPAVQDPGAKVHLYGKSVRPGRKVGHVTVMGTHAEDVRKRAANVAAVIKQGDQ